MEQSFTSTPTTKNLTFENFNTQRVLRWRCFVEEFNPRLFYIEGKKNIIADAFSRLPREDDPNTSAVELNCLMLDEWVGCCRTNPAVALSHLPYDQEEIQMVDSSDTFFGNQIMDRVMLTLPTLKEEMYDCFFNVPDVPMQHNPLNMEWIAQSQAKDARTKELRQTPTKYYHLRPFGDVNVLCHVRPGADADSQWRIELTDETVKPAV